MNHTIEIEGLPEGYELTDRPVEINRMLGENTDNGTMQVSATIFLQKSKPRRIVLEETDETSRADQPQPRAGGAVVVYANKIWREIKEE